MLMCMKPSFWSSSDRGFFWGKGSGGADGRILYTNFGEASDVMMEGVLLVARAGVVKSWSMSKLVEDPLNLAIHA